MDAIKSEHDEWAPVDYVNAAQGDNELVAEIAQRWAKEISRRLILRAEIKSALDTVPLLHDISNGAIDYLHSTLLDED